MGYFVFTWMQKPANYSNTNYIITCVVAMLVTMIFFLLNKRITELIWGCQNTAYKIEKELGIIYNGNMKYLKLGLYGNLLSETIKIKLDEIDEQNFDNYEEYYKTLKDVTKPTIKAHFNFKKHTGQINLLFIAVMIIYIMLLFQTGSFNKGKQDVDKINNEIINIY